MKDNQTKKEMAKMRCKIGLCDVLKAENQEECAEMDQNEQLPDNIFWKTSGYSKIYYVVKDRVLQTDEDAYIRLKKAAMLDEIKKHEEKIDENTSLLVKYVKLFYVLAIIGVICGVIVGIVSLCHGCS